MSYLTVVSRLVGLSLQNRSIHTANQLLIKSTPILCAEPLKKKKKIDPQIVKQREERKRKKIEKQIRRLEKNARQLKPIDELEIPLTLIDEKDLRKRKNIVITPELQESRVAIEKAWANYKLKQKLADLQQIDRILMAQEKALNELKFESEELYQEAIQTDVNLVPFTTKGPVSTPPIEKYESPDGEYINASKKWE